MNIMTAVFLLNMTANCVSSHYYDPFYCIVLSFCTVLELLSLFTFVFSCIHGTLAVKLKDYYYYNINVRLSRRTVIHVNNNINNI